MATKIQRVYQQVSAEGVLTANIYDPVPDPTTNKQKVLYKRDYDVSVFPEKALLIAAAKGFGTYAATRATPAPGEELTPEAIEDAYNEVYEEFKAGAFEPGRTGEGKENLLHEAIAEFLNQPLADIKAQIKNGAGTFTPALLGQIAKTPEIEAIKARLERQRAADKEKAAKARMKAGREGGLDVRALFGAPAAEAPAA